MKLSLIVLLVGCAYIQIVRKDYTDKLRDKIAFVCLGYLPISLALMNFREVLPVVVSLNSILVLLNCIGVVLLLSLSQSKIRYSSPHRRIFFFWIYMLICSFWSEAWLPVLSGKLSACLVFFGGVALGQHILLRRKLDVALKILTCAGIFVVWVIYFFALPKLAGYNIVEQMGWVRIGARGLINPNSIAMVLIPFTLISLIRIFVPVSTGGKRTNFLWNVAGGGLCLLAGWLLVRTGSRSAFFGAYVGAIVILSFNARSRQSRIALSVLLVMILAWFVTNNYTGLRVLDIGGGTDYISLGGRGIEWEAALNSLSGLQKVFGSGGIVCDSLGELTWGGYLSIYVTIYQAAGVVGCALLAGFIFSVARQVLRIGKSAMPAAAFIAAALVFGVGEASPIRPFNIQCLFFGFGVGLLPLQRVFVPSKSLAKAQGSKPVLRVGKT